MVNEKIHELIDRSIITLHLSGKKSASTIEVTEGSYTDEKAEK